MKLLKWLGNIGVSGNHTEEYNRYVIITNYCLLIGIFGILLYGGLDYIVDYKDLFPVFWKSTPFIFLFLIGFFFNKKQWHELAKHTLGIGVISMIFYVTGYEYGRDSYMHLFFLLIGVMPVLLWPMKQWYIIAFYLLTSIFCLIYVEFLMPASAIHTPFPKEGKLLFALTTTSLIFFTVIIQVLIFKKLIEDKEKVILKNSQEIENKSKEVEILNHDLNIQKEELIDLNATKDKFFSIIAHDLRNPFNALLGLTQLLQKNLKTYNQNQIEGIVSSLNLSAKNTYDLLINLLDWARIQKKSIDFSPESIKLSSVVNSINKLMESQANAKNIKLISNISQELHVFADANMLSTIIRNLISNAIKFSNAGDEILISNHSEGAKTIVSIKDFGIGISEENLIKLFKIDSNFLTKGTNNEYGTGLGLILCKEFIDIHHEDIWVESIEGKGSTFHFSLLIDNKKY